MPEGPATPETASALGRFFTGGSGPRHTDLDAVFAATGHAAIAPYNAPQGPTKETRVRAVVGQAAQDPDGGRALIEALLADMRVHGCFSVGSADYDAAVVQAAQQAFRRAGWELGNDGLLRSINLVDLLSGGRPAIDEQLARLRRATDDPALMLGTAKDLLEAVAKFVLEELGTPARSGADFSELWYLSRDRLNIHPRDADDEQPGAVQVRAIHQSAWTIAQQVNELRGLQGTGHGRTLPTGITAEMARFVVREACSVAEYVLQTLDRALGRGTGGLGSSAR